MMAPSAHEPLQFLQDRVHAPGALGLLRAPARQPRLRQRHRVILDRRCKPWERIDPGDLLKLGNRYVPPLIAIGILHEIGGRLVAFGVVDGLEDVGRHQHPPAQALQGRALEDWAADDIQVS